jgi:serine/threonine protein kinase
MCKSLETSSPEIISGRSYNSKCDIWNSGIILYNMICGKLPFSGKNHQSISKQILSAEPNYDGIPADLANLIQQLLQKNPENRISLSDLQNQVSFLSFDYNQFLRVKLEDVKTFYEEAVIVYDSDTIISRRCQITKDRILMKDNITNFLECLNQNEANQGSLGSSSNSDKKKSHKSPIVCSLSEPTNMLFQSRKLLWDEKNPQINQQKTHFIRNRQTTIQKTIISSHHAPILISAKTGNSDQ